jgi:hypothetical protein
MNAPPSDRTGILVLHLWIETGTPERFRARITQKFDSGDREQTASAAATPEDVYAAVRTWVTRFLDTDLARDASVTPRNDGVTDISDFRRE